MNSGIDWPRIKLLTFDCYGTLVNWDAGILSVLRPWAARANVEASDAELLDAYAKAESKAEHAMSASVYREVLHATMQGIAEQFGKASSPEENDSLANSVGDWPVFPDTVEALQALKRWHKLMVVSNVDKISFNRTAPKLGVQLDGLVMAEEVGAYKPDVRMFERALRVAAEMGVKKDEVLHVAQSLYHDIVPANAMGIANVWVNRRGEGTGSVTPDLIVGSLGDLVSLEMRERERSAKA